ncbi:MAG TPA: 5-deoxy-glucuronate isomerase [Euzebyales bacterium]|nr:5-deoxy-glucuronate isomerase [Euzebyales bacterium]
MTDTLRLHRTAAELGTGPWTLEVKPKSAGWEHSSLRILDLPAGGAHEFDTDEDETLVLPLSGSCVVACEDERFDLDGRDDVFTQISDFAYIPRDATVHISSEQGGRFALPAARASRRLRPRYGPAADVPSELRGAGQCSRQVVNFATPEAFEADNLIACEVLTPAGNWSSFPPHKHDEERPGEETPLEEIYYFVVADGPTGPGMAYQRVYGTDDRPIDVLVEVRSGDVVLIPHGWHGPSMAVPGYDLYYLNVMAGPGAERAWRICFDAAHAWVTETWGEQQIDSRLPMSAAEPGPAEDLPMSSAVSEERNRQ